MSDNKTILSVYFTAKTIKEYLETYGNKNPDSKEHEIWLAYLNLKVTQKITRDNSWKVGFPLKNSKDHELRKIPVQNIHDVHIFFSKNFREDSTLVDYSICKVEDNFVRDIPKNAGFSVQQKRYGKNATENSAESLLEYLKKYERYPKASTSLYIVLEKYALNINIQQVASSMSGTTFSFHEVVIQAIRVRNNILETLVVRVYPEFVPTFTQLLPGEI